MKQYLKTYTAQLLALVALGVASLLGVLPAEAALLSVAILGVNSAGIPLFAGVEPLDDMFMATMEEMDKEVMDELSVSHPVWEYIQQKNLIEYVEEIGTHVIGHLRRFKNGTVKWVSGYDDADNTPAQLLGETKTAYGHLAGTQMYNREELVKNQGKQQLIDLVESKSEQLLEDLDTEFAETIVGTQDADGRKPLGIGRIMDPALACCGIDPATAGFEFWKPYKVEKSAGVNFALATEFRDGIRKMYREVHLAGGGRVLGASKKDKSTPLTGGSGYVLIAGTDLYNEHQKYAENALRLTIADLKGQQGWGNFEMFDYNGTTIIYDPTLGAKVGWFINFKSGIRVRIHRGTNFKYDDWQMMANKVQTKKRNNLTYMAVYAKSRRANAVVTFS
ncbi:MAG: phage major capsid protein [Pseudomonadota bacterium]